MTTRHDDRPTEEMSAQALAEMLRRGGEIGFMATSDTPVVVDDATRAIDEAAAQISIDLPLDAPEGEAVGFDAPPLDPRFTQRRDEVARHRRRARRQRIAMIALAPLLGAGAVVAAYSPLLDIDHLHLVGSDILTAAELESLTGLSTGDPMLTTRLSAVSEALAADPRFLRVDVSRSWPNAVTIRTTDRRFVAALDGPTRSVIVGEGGVIVRESAEGDFIRRVAVAEDPSGKPGDRLPDALAAAIDVIGTLPYEISSQIETVTINVEGEIVLSLTSGATVLFGTVEGAADKVQSVLTMLTSNVDRDGVCQIDVRVPHAPTMRRQPNCIPLTRPRDLAAQQAEADAAAAAAALTGETVGVEGGQLPGGELPGGEVPVVAAGTEQPVIEPTPPAGAGTVSPPVAPDGGILTAPTAAATSSGSNREPGADGG